MSEETSPFLYGTAKYVASVNSARHYLRYRDFLTYASQLVPKPIGSETWSLAWAYMRHFDDMLDSPALSSSEAFSLLEHEREIVESGFAGNLQVAPTVLIRHQWLAQFFDNERRYFAGKALPVVTDLYESAWEDVARKGKVLSQKDMNLLLYKKARSFFKLYFILGNFDLGNHINDFSYLLGMGLGMLDDVLDVVSDYKSGYVNITREEMEVLGVDLEPGDKGFLQRVIESGYLTYRAKKIMSVLLRARKLTCHVRVPLVRKLILRLTEIFAAPILEKRLIPGQRYFFKGGSLANRLLPKNESIAYHIGHKLIGFFLMYPQVFSIFFKRTPAMSVTIL